MKKLGILLIFLMSFTGTAFANINDDPSIFLESIAKKMIDAVEKNKESIKTDASIAENLVRKHLLPVIDTNTFSKKTLGKKRWKSMSPSQQTKFTNNYVEQIIGKYAKGLSLYDGQAFEFEKAEIRSNKARVKSSMKQSGSQPLSIVYFLGKSANQWLITNIYVEGTNMTKSYKNQFLPRINEIGIDKFIKELSESNKSASK